MRVPIEKGERTLRKLTAKTIKRIGAIAIIGMLMAPTTMTVIAAPSLDEITATESSNGNVGNVGNVGNSSQYSGGTTSSNGGATYNGSDFMNDLSTSLDMSQVNSQKSKEINSALREKTGMFMQVACYVIPLFLAVRIALDIGWIVLPIPKEVGDNGNVPAPASNGGGWGTTPTATSNNTVGNKGKLNIISKQAKSAYVNGFKQSQDGSVGKSPVAIYFSTITVEIILVPIMLVLAVTGAASGLGFALGNLIGKILVSLSNVINGIAI